ncbi:MAG: PIN domain-containing protein [Phycisphaerales bacterium]|nr:PIN domain-containing protein [Phycisphaerales bacterium]
MTLIWALKDNPTEENADFHRRAELLMKQLTRDKAIVVLPTIVIGEYLCKVPKSSHGQIVAKLQERFRIVPFDVRASSMAADLWQKRQNLPHSRRLLKADMLVIASAEAAGAERFYSADAECRAVAELVMEAYDLPTFNEKLFDDDVDTQ